MKKELGYLILVVVIGAIIGACGAAYLRLSATKLASDVQARKATSDTVGDVNWDSRVEI